MSSSASVRMRHKLSERFFSYIRDMKRGEEDKVAHRIAQDVELLLMEQKILTRQLENKIVKLKNEVVQ